MHIYERVAFPFWKFCNPQNIWVGSAQLFAHWKFVLLSLFYLFLFLFSVSRDACLYVEDIDRRRRRRPIYICTFFLKMQVLIWFSFGHVAFFRSKFGNDKPLKTCMSRKIEREKRSGAAAQNRIDMRWKEKTFHRPAQSNPIWFNIIRKKYTTTITFKLIFN